MQSNRQGFIMYYAILIGIVFVALAYAVSQVIESNRLYFTYNDSVTDSDNFTRNGINTIFTIDEKVNSNGSGGTASDILSCSGGVITCREGFPAICSTGEWDSTRSDGIADTCDDDDYRGTYFTGNVSNLLSPDSKAMDDDDVARRRHTGFVPPSGDIVQVFAMNTPIKQAITLNKNNTGPALLPDTVDTVVLDGVFSATGASVFLYQLDKNVLDTAKTVSVVHMYSGSILSLSGVLGADGNFTASGTTAPLALNIRLYDYALFIKSPLSALLYDIGATDALLGKPVYTVPLDDSVTPWTLLVPDYRFYDDELIYRSQTVKQ